MLQNNQKNSIVSSNSLRIISQIEYMYYMRKKCTLSQIFKSRIPDSEKLLN